MLIMFMLVVLGLIFGSFTNALTWRLYQQSHPVRTKSKHQKVDYSILKGRSVCPQCKHTLAAIDLIPVLSWLALQGKCRYCRKPISVQYPVVELITALLFVLSYLCWPDGFRGRGEFEFVLWLIFLVGFVALAVYDLKWFLLPNRLVYPLIVLALLQVLIVAGFYGGGYAALLNGLWGVAIASGVFAVLFYISKGRWIGGGDVKLGLVLGLLVGGPLMSWLLLFVASLSGTLLSLPLVITGKANRKSHLPFGPLLIFAAILVRLFGTEVIHWAMGHYFI